MLTETTLRHLYRWHLDLLLLAIMKQGGDSFSGDSLDTSGPGASIRERRAALFSALAQSVGNPEYATAFQALSQRLEAVREVEDLFLDETEAETAEIVDALRSNDRRRLRGSLVRYHRRRERVVPEIIAKLLHG
jgi:DNA-binding FadR family transcriptional regulator